MKTLTRQVLTCVLIILVSFAFIIGCQKAGNESKNKESSIKLSPPPPPTIEGDVWTYTDPETGVTLTFTYSYSTTETDTTITTSLVATGGGSETIIDYGTLILDAGNVKDKDALREILLNAYGNIFTAYGYSILESYAGLVEKMLESIAEEAEQNTLKTYVFQSLCMYNTLAKAVNRDIGRTGTVPFSITEGYLRDLTSFAAEEDLIINVDDFKVWLDTRREIQPQNEGIDYLTNGLASLHGTLSLNEIDLAMDEYFTNTYGRYPQGGECGCCGNYDGPCLHWSKLCLAHDFMCENCKPRWFCFSGCVASSCTGNTIAPYYFLTSTVL